MFFFRHGQFGYVSGDFSSVKNVCYINYISQPFFLHELQKCDFVNSPLTQNFGYKHAILSTIIEKHKRLGQIPSGQEMCFQFRLQTCTNG